MYCQRQAVRRKSELPLILLFALAVHIAPSQVATLNPIDPPLAASAANFDPANGFVSVNRPGFCGGSEKLGIGVASFAEFTFLPNPLLAASATV